MPFSLVDQLLVTLGGEASSYTEMLNDAEDHIKDTVDVIEAETKRMAKAQERALADAARITEAALTPQERYLKLTDELEEHLAKNRISQEAYNRTLKRYGQELPESVEVTKRLNREMARARQITRSVWTEAEVYADRQDELNQLLRRGRIGVEVHTRALKKLEEEYAVLAEEVKVVDAELVQLQRGSLKDVKQGINNLGQAISSAGRKLSLFVTGPLTLFAGFSLRSAGVFADDLRSIESASNLSEKQLQHLETQVMSLSRELRQSPRVFQGAFDELLRAGFSLEEALDGSAEATVRFAKVSKMSTKDAAETVVASLRVFQKDNLSAADAVNILSQAADASIVDLEQMVESLRQGGAVASLSGLSLRDFSIAVALMGDMGVVGSDAGTSLKTFFLNLSDPKNQATLRNLAGLSDDVIVNMSDLKSVMELLDQATAGMAPQERTSVLRDIFGSDSVRAAAVLAQQGAKGFERLEGELAKSLTVAEKYEVIMSEWMGMWNSFRASVERVAISVGKSLMPAFRALLGWVEKGLKWFEDLDAETQRWIMGFAALAAAIGPVLIALGAAITFIGGLIAIGGTALGVAAAIVVGLASIALQMVAVIGATANLVYWLVGAGGLKSAWDSISTSVSNFVSNAIGFMANFRSNISSIVSWLSENWDLVIMDMGRAWIAFMSNIPKNAMVGWRTLIRLFTAFQGWIVGRFQQVFTVEFVRWVATGVKKAIGIFMDFGQHAFEALQSIFTGKSVDFSDFLGQLDKDLKAGVKEKDFFKTARDILREEATKFTNPLEGFESSITEGPELSFEQGKKKGKDFGKGVADGLRQTAEDMKAAADRLAGVPEGRLSDAQVALQDKVDQLTHSLQRQQATFGMTSREAQLHNLALDGASEAQLKLAKEANKALNALEAEQEALKKHQDIMKQGEQVTKQFRTAQEIFRDTTAELQMLFRKGAIDLETLNRGLKDAEEKLEEAKKKGEVNVKFSVSGIDAIAIGSIEALSRIQEFQAGLKDPKQAKLPANARPDQQFIDRMDKVKLQEDKDDEKEKEALEAIAVNTGKIASRPSFVFNKADIGSN